MGTSDPCVYTDSSTAPNLGEPMPSDQDLDQKNSRPPGSDSRSREDDGDQGRLGGREEPFEEAPVGPGRHGDKPEPGIEPDSRHDGVNGVDDVDANGVDADDVDAGRPHRNV